LKALTLRLSDSVNAVLANDMRGPEAMLYSEAHALKAIFVDLSRRATNSRTWVITNLSCAWP